jgi:diaminopimelate decarboxylase
MTFEETIDGVSQIVDELFPAEVNVIAEPGRYFCTAAYTLAVTIISRRDRFVCHNRYAFGPYLFSFFDIDVSLG